MPVEPRRPAQNPSQDRPTEPPDTARTYERANPQKESATGQLGQQLPGRATQDRPDRINVPDEHDDRMSDAVPNQQESRNLVAQNEDLDFRDTPDLSNDTAAKRPSHPSPTVHQKGWDAPPNTPKQQTSQQNLQPLPGGPTQGGRRSDPSKPISPQPDGSMIEEEPLGWDQAPTGSPNDHDDFPAGNTRHPRQAGKGGTPDVGEPNDRG